MQVDVAAYHVAHSLTQCDRKIFHCYLTAKS